MDRRVDSVVLREIAFSCFTEEVPTFSETRAWGKFGKSDIIKEKSPNPSIARS
jgi:hypothetical protein